MTVPRVDVESADEAMVRFFYIAGGTPPADRFADYQAALSRLPVPLAAGGEPTGFDARMGACQLSGSTLAVNQVRGGPTTFHRTAGLVRRSDPEGYRLLLNRSGRIKLAHEGREAVLRPQDVALYTTSRPFEGLRDPAGGVSTLVMFTFPRQAVSLPPGPVRGLLGSGMCGRTGPAAVVASFLAQLADTATDCTDADLDRLGRVAVDLVVALLAHELELSCALSPQAQREFLMARAHAFIDAHLDDPALCPQLVADAHHVSLRLLQKLFEAQVATVAGTIRERRLARCHADLADPSFAARPVAAVAARWQFRSEAHFSRLFRARFGMSPSDWRRTSQDR